MRVLPDEMLDRRLALLLPDGIETSTVRGRGWGSLKNGELLEAARQELDVLLTGTSIERWPRARYVVRKLDSGGLQETRLTNLTDTCLNDNILSYG